jgi:hypothetical protein
MKLATCVVLLIGVLGGVASADKEVPGHWVWRGPMTGDQPHQFSTVAACKAWIRWDFKQTHTDRKYVTVKPPKDPVTTNNYTCTWIDKADNKKQVQDSVEILAATYACPMSSTAHTLNNSGKVADYSCLCPDGQVCDQGPPFPDLSSRCKQQPAKTVSPADAAVTSKQNQANVAKYGDKDMLAEYKYLRDNEAVVRECDFKPADLCTNGPNDINVGLLCGYRSGDEAAANNLAGFGTTPDNCTWHHHQDLGRMQLVKTAIHERCSHDGGASIWKEALGMKSYPAHVSQ